MPWVCRLSDDRVSGDVTFLLDVTPTAGLNWQRTAEVRIGRVESADGRRLEPVPDAEPISRFHSGGYYAAHESPGLPFAAIPARPGNGRSFPITLAADRAVTKLKVLEGIDCGDVHRANPRSGRLRDVHLVDLPRRHLLRDRRPDTGRRGVGREQQRGRTRQQLPLTHRVPRPDGIDRVFSLDGKTAVITGAASGIGAATAQLFAAAGANVVLGWYGGDPHDIQPVLAGIEAAGGTACAVEADVSKTEDVQRLLRVATDELGGLDIVVANAGIARLVPSAELSDEQWRELMEVDLLGVFRCFREAIPHLRAQRHGRLLATSSIAGAHAGWAEHAHYTAAKAGVMGLVRTLAVELGPDGITVNAIAPGVIVTPQSSDPVNSLGPDGLDLFAQKVPVRRNGRSEDIAAAYLYLASDEASYVTGQTILVDGGVSLPL